MISSFRMLILDLHISVGNSKILQGPQEFVSDVIGGIGIVGESEYASKRDKQQENYPVVSRSRRQNFTIENENANENAHLSRLYPLQMDELLEQKQIVPTPNLQVLDAPLKPRLEIDKSMNITTVPTLWESPIRTLLVLFIVQRESGLGSPRV